MVEQGTHAELLARSPRYRALLALAGRRPQHDLRRIWPLLRPQRRLIVAAALAMVGATAVSLAAPLLAKVAIDRGIEKHDPHVINVIALVYLGLDRRAAGSRAGDRACERTRGRALPGDLRVARVRQAAGSSRCRSSSRRARVCSSRA